MVCFANVFKKQTMSAVSDMAGTLVYVLLLNSINETILDQTLTTANDQDHPALKIQQCNKNIDPVIKVINEQLNVTIVPKWEIKTSDKQPYANHTRSIDLDDSEEHLLDIQAVLDNSLAEFDNSNDFDGESPMENKYTKLNTFGYIFDDTKASTTTSKVNLHFHTEKIPVLRTARPEFSDKVPYLVAIFETLVNVTAQTCAGALVAPHWVLTSAFCVNLLGDVYGNESISANSSYTIIANTANPLQDGTAHNVTHIVIYPDDFDPISLINEKNLKREVFEKQMNKPPTLALMRVEPKVDAGVAELATLVPNDKAAVRVYGWVLEKNSSGETFTRASALPVAVAAADACDSYSTGADVFCLSIDNTTLFDQMSCGAPAVSGGYLSGVTLSGERPALAAGAVAHYRTWIQKIVASN